MGQEWNANEDNRRWAALGRVEIQAEMLEEWVVTLDNELDIDMEARPSDCRAADDELSRILTTMDGIQAKTAVTETRKRGIMKRLDRIMDTIDDKMEEATEYRRTKDE